MKKLCPRQLISPDDEIPFLPARPLSPGLNYLRKKPASCFRLNGLSEVDNSRCSPAPRQWCSLLLKVQKQARSKCLFRPDFVRASASYSEKPHQYSAPKWN